MKIVKGLITADKGVIRFTLEGKVRYGLWSKGRIRLYDSSPLSGGKPGKTPVRPSDVRLLTPCRPSKVVAVAMNYKDHARRLKRKLPKEPVIFLKPATAVVGPGEPILLPPVSRRVDYEAELGVVIGRTCRKVDPEHVQDYILGYTCVNDVTARDIQKRDGQYTRSHGHDTFCPLGPAIALDLNVARLRLRTYINKEVRQEGNTADLIFKIPELVSFVSRVMTLNPGDVIATGTPYGVGPVREGDEVAVEVQGVGRLVNPVKNRG